MFEFIDGPVFGSILEGFWFIMGTFGLLHLCEKIKRRLILRREWRR
jgi:hypothetical protein